MTGESADILAQDQGKKETTLAAFGRINASIANQTRVVQTTCFLFVPSLSTQSTTHAFHRPAPCADFVFPLPLFVLAMME